MAIVDSYGVALDFATLHSASSRYAIALESRFGLGDRVALVFDRHDWLAFAVAYFAALASGVVPVLLENHEHRIVRRLEDTGARGVIVGPGGERRSKSWLGMDELSSPANGFKEYTPRHGDDRLLDVLYTSGTVDGSYEPVEYFESDWLDGHTVRPMRRQVTCVHALFPPHSSAGVHGLLLGHLIRGVKSVASSTLNVHDLGAEAYALTESIRVHRPREVVLAPALITEMNARGLVDLPTFASVRTIKFGGAPLPREQGTALMSALPHVQILSMYGTTEASRALMTARWSPDRPDAIGRVGQTVAVVGANGVPLEHGEEGEIALKPKGPAVRTQYSGGRGLAHRGWTRTGDIGRVDGDGWVRIVGRSKEVLVLSSGAKVNASNIERQIRRHHAVVDVKVAGLPRPGLATDTVVASIVLVDGFDAKVVGEVYAALEPNAVPERTLLVDELPRNAMAKVVVPAVRAALAGLPAGIIDRRWSAPASKLDQTGSASQTWSQR